MESRSGRRLRADLPRGGRAWATGESPRPVRVAKGLPNGRAVVGGLLIAVAGVGTFAAYSGATADHRVDYVVARSSLSVGERLSMSDLTTAPMSLPAPMAKRWAFRNPATLVGAVVVGPVSGGELVQASDVLAGPLAPGQSEVSFAISKADAVGGTLSPGDRVDVLATVGTGLQAKTESVLSDAPVIAQVADPSSLGANDTGTVTVTLGLSGGVQALALTQAVNSGTVMLVRVTGSAPMAAGSMGAGSVGTS